jgi:diguanylate cyclase (GGDEF)-like protein
MKRIPLSGLKGHVARRLFVLFLTAALLPVGAAGYFAYVQVGDTLIDLNYRHLEQDAKAVGMGLVQRLNWREQALKSLASSLAAGGGTGGVTRIPSRLEGTGTLEVVGQESLVDLTSSQVAHLGKGKVVLRLSGRNEPIMLAAINGSSDLIQVRLDAAALWYDNEEAGRGYCILTSLGAPIYCTPTLVPPPSQWLAPLAGNNSGVFPWTVDGEDHLAAYWRARLQASMANEGFIVVVSDEKRQVLAVLTRFRQMFPAILVLALALAAWLSIGQIRRQMRPLELLEEGTRRLADGEFSSRVEVAGDGEFAMLAGSFNRMAEKLDNKFHLLQALGEIDQAILAVAEIDYVVTLLLRHVPLATPCDGAGVLRFEDATRTRLLIADERPGVNAVHTQPHSETPWRPDWKSDIPWLLVDLATPDSGCLQYFAARGATQALVFPVRIGERMDSALVLAYRKLPNDMDEIAQAGRTLADRLAAAQSSIAWEGKLYHQAHFDSLTDLPNRVMLRDRVEQALLRARREDASVAVMLVDLDDFKQVNDSLGHSAGDLLLVSIAERLKTLARSTDTVARLGGDEFVVLIPDLPLDSAISSIDRIARTLSVELARPLEIIGRRISSPVSIGVALFPDNADSVEDLLKMADAAMYETKREQRGGYRFYNNSMNTEIMAHFELAQELREAMEQNEFFLVYQPKVDAATGRLVGAEALIRWQSPTRGMVSPVLFISVIDEIGLGSRLGTWVLNAACAQMAAWDAMGYSPVPISVNVSPAQFHSGEIIGQVRVALGQNALDPQRLELEILESTALSDSSSTIALLGELRDMGISIALDDFGTGYSSLVYLVQLPVNVLKIDRGFIINLLKDERQQMIADCIISLAKALHYTVVAEGVEEEAQMRMLVTMGCDVFQGYLFSRPLDVKAFEAFMSDELTQPETPGPLAPSSLLR